MVFNMRRRDQAPNSPAEAAVPDRRAALYMRVSTGRQAEHDLSIPDQRRQLEAWCRTQGYIVGAEFIESGASAGDDRRPVFQQMIERACDGEQAFDLILVHSYSRFFREAFEQEFYLRKLGKHGVKVVSITQPVGDESEPVQAMMRKVIALFDEYQSKENAKHVIRSMKETRARGSGTEPRLRSATSWLRLRSAARKSRRNWTSTLSKPKLSDSFISCTCTATATRARSVSKKSSSGSTETATVPGEARALGLPPLTKF